MTALARWAVYDYQKKDNSPCFVAVNCNFFWSENKTDAEVNIFFDRLDVVIRPVTVYQLSCHY